MFDSAREGLIVLLFAVGVSLVLSPVVAYVLVLYGELPAVAIILLAVPSTAWLLFKGMLKRGVF